MRNYILSILIATSLTVGACVTPVSAQDTTYEIYRLPEGYEWSDNSVKDDEGNTVTRTYMCYDWDQYVLLLNMDVDLQAAEGKIPNLTAAVAELRSSNDLRVQALIESNKQVQLIEKDRQRISLKWEKDNEAKHKAENKPMFGSWLPWGVSGVLAGVLAGVLLAP